MKKRYIIIPVAVIAVAAIVVLVSIHIQKVNKHQGHLVTSGNFIGDVISEGSIVYEGLTSECKREDVIAYCSNQDESLAHLEDWLKETKILREESMELTDIGLEEWVVYYQFQPKDGRYNEGQLGVVEFTYFFNEEGKKEEIYSKIVELIYDNFPQENIMDKEVPGSKKTFENSMQKLNDCYYIVPADIAVVLENGICVVEVSNTLIQIQLIYDYVER